ncbi:alpha/beta hydrolase [Burkholderia cepacia]|uniref:alpha/beta hydrolase n=1 Tax=Burkholderia cepacia TaxID=292 RepID=UPI0009BE584C|nr:alpha/beta hydrolase [Burkholderia cepacia]
MSDRTPQSFEAHLQSLGARFDPDVLQATRSLYRLHLDLVPAGDERTDVVYGVHERHRLDVYSASGSARAIVIFVHGGGFVAGDKNADGTFYANVGRWLARHGFTAVLPNYRLAPAHPWPAGAEDVGAVVAWTHQHLSTGRDAQVPLVLWGQSAGATHVATWLFDPRQSGPTDHKVLSSIMLMNGFYEAASPLTAGPRAYFGEDASIYADRSPLTHVRPVDVPLWVSIAELDPAWLVLQTYALARAVTVAQGNSPHFHYFRGHNHVSTVQSIGSPHTSAADAVLEFLSALPPR